MMLKKYRYMLYKILILSFLLIISGCDAALLDPKGSIGQEQRTLIITSLLLMLIVVIPVIIMTFLFAWKFRASNTSAKYTPDLDHSNKIEVIVWGIPFIIIIILSIITYISTHQLDPKKPIQPSQNKPLTIEVISLDWKWMFIYPELSIATINEIVFPVNTPIEFKVTSYTVMNSFFIPQLGSQIYAMAGMKNHVHLIANEVGKYHGISANYSGAGFSGMKFIAEATTQNGFDNWVSNVRKTHNPLTLSSFESVTQPSENHPVEYYAPVKAGLYDDIVAQFTGHSNIHTAVHAEVEE